MKVEITKIMNSTEILKEIKNQLEQLEHKGYDKNSFKSGYLLGYAKALQLQQPLVSEVVFTKDMFIKAIHEIEKQYNHDRKCSEAFKVLLPNDYTSNYDNHWLQNQLIEILQIAMNDNHKDSWIEYYMWELDFGRKWKKDSVKVKGKNFKLQNAYDLWDLLNLT
jgi:hypothetical protein